MDKKKIISSTIVFFITTSIVLLFSGIFGGENVLVGVQGTAAVLFLLTIDFSLNPVKNTIYFVLLELTIGLAAYIASLNPYLAIISTFLMMFYIFYTFTYNTKKPAFLPFSLAFIYMLYDPVTAQQLPKRFLGLIVCGLAIMLLQILANKDRLKKESVSKLNNALESINKQIELVNTNSTERLSLNKDAEVNLNQLIESFTFAINQNKSKVSIDLLKYLSIAQFLDSLNIELNKTNKFTNTEDLSALLNSIKLYVNNESNIDSILDNISVYESKNLENYNNNLNLVVYPYVAKLKRDLQQTNADKIINEYSRSKFFENFNLKNGANTFLITSCVPQEGKTTTALNLAISLANKGKKTLLIDGDLRMCSVGEKLMITYQCELSKIISEERLDLSDLQKTSIENLTVVGNNQKISNSGEILSSKFLPDLIKFYQQYFDYVIVDASKVQKI